MYSFTIQEKGPNTGLWDLTACAWLHKWVGGARTPFSQGLSLVSSSGYGFVHVCTGCGKLASFLHAISDRGLPFSLGDMFLDDKDNFMRIIIIR